MADTFSNHETGLITPAVDWFDITLADSDLAVVPRAISCTGSGEVDIQSADGSVVTITLDAGAIWPVRPVRVKSTTGSGSDATGVIGLV